MTTNLLLYSERLDVPAAWTKTGATAADRTLTEAAGGTYHYVSVAADAKPALTVGETYTFSVHAEAGDRTWLALGDYTGVPTHCSYFDLANGSAGTKGAAHTASAITPLDGGGYRCSITFVAASADGYVYAFIAEADGDRGFDGDPGTYPAGIDVWGAQLEPGATVTEYTPNPPPGEVAAINAALAAAVPGGTVTLTAGTHTCGGNIVVPVGVSLVGEPGAALDFVAGFPLLLTAMGENTIADLELTGGINLRVSGSHVAVERVTSRATVYLRACFDIRKAGGGVIEDIAFTDCHSIDSSGWGFEIFHYEAAPLLVKDVTFSGCTAINCGAAHDLYNAYREYVVGFDLAECDRTLTTENILVTGCIAEGCYESGFHTEERGTAINCRMIQCTARNNGITKPDVVYGWGVRLHPGWEMVDCLAVGNYRGIYFTYDGLLVDRNLPIRLTRCEARDNREAGIKITGWTEDYRSITNVALADCTIVGVPEGVNYLGLHVVDGARVTGLRVADCDGALLYQFPTTNSNTFTYHLGQFAASIAAPVTGETVAFADTSENDALTAWAWDFGDGSGSSAQHPTHAYPAAGVYPVTLTAGGNVVSGTVTVVPGVSYGGARLSEADIGPLDHDPVANATDLHSGRVGLQGSPVSRRQWTINALADDHAEIEALALLKGRHLTLNLNGVEYPGVMIRPPMLETQLTPAAWAYQIGLVQETRR